MNRAERIYMYLKEHGSITSMDAIQNFGYTRLSAAIFEVKRDGHKIRRVNETSKNRDGIPVTYARYYLEDKA